MNEIILSPQYSAYRSVLEEIETLFEQGETIYNQRNVIKVITLPDGSRLNVKRYRVPILPNRIIYSTLRKPKAVRAYQNALRLAVLGVPTPAPIGIRIERQWGLLATSYLITEQVELKRNMYEMEGDNLPEGSSEILRAFAAFTAELHRKGVYHKDYSPGNILFDVDKEGQVHFCIVDINRMSFGQHSLESRCRNFARLWCGPKMMQLIAQEYARCMGEEISRVQRLVLQYHERFWHNR